MIYHQQLQGTLPGCRSDKPVAATRTLDIAAQFRGRDGSGNAKTHNASHPRAVMGVVSDLPEPLAGASAARRPVLSRAVDWVTVGLSILAVGACQTARSSPPPAVPSVVLRTPVYLDSAGVADGTGQVRVAVRAAPRPTEGSATRW